MKFKEILLLIIGISIIAVLTFIFFLDKKSIHGESKQTTITATPTEEAATTIMGVWRLSKLVVSTAITPMQIEREDQSSFIHGKLVFNTDKAEINKDLINSPVYLESQVDDELLLNSFGIKLETLGITNRNARLFTIKGQETEGGYIIVKDSNHIIVNINGDFISFTRE